MLSRFGIEIRKIGDKKSFFKDVDSILEASGMESKKVTGDIQVQATAHALQKMIDGNHFSVCTIDNCRKMCGIVILKERQDIYDAIHCLNWNEMLPDFRQQVIAMVMDDFRSLFEEQVYHHQDTDIEEVKLLTN